MARRGGNEGSVYRRKDGRWAGVLNVGYHGGKRERKAFYGATRQEVASRLAAATRDLQQGRKPAPEQETAGTYLQRWLEDTHRRTVRASTFTTYESNLRRHILPALGHLKLARLTADDLDKMYAHMLDQGLSPKTVRLCHAIVNKALKHAQRRGLVAANVAAIACAPSAPRKQLPVLDPGQAATFLATAQGDPFHALYLLAVTGGLRLGELLAVRWGDLDLDVGQLSVNQQVYWLDGGWVFTEPKTAASRRTISLSASVITALREHRLRQTAKRLQAPEWADHDLVFTNNRGGPVERKSLKSQSFHPLLARAQLPRVRFHSLRHSCATLMLAAGTNPKIVMERLGHSSISVTMDVYSHVLPNQQADAAEKMELLLAAEG